MLQYLKASSGGITNLGHQVIDGFSTTGYHANLQISKIPDAVPPSEKAAAQAAMSKIQQLAHISAIPVSVWIDNRQLVRRMALNITATAQGQTINENITLDIPEYGPQSPPPTLPPASEVAPASSLIHSSSSSGWTALARADLPGEGVHRGSSAGQRSADNRYVSYSAPTPSVPPPSASVPPPGIAAPASDDPAQDTEPGVRARGPRTVAASVALVAALAAAAYVALGSSSNNVVDPVGRRGGSLCRTCTGLPRAADDEHDQLDRDERERDRIGELRPVGADRRVHDRDELP